MKLVYKNYIIEDDRNGFILSVIWEKWEDSKFEWETYIKEQIYPSTLARCFERIFKIEKMNINKEFEIKWYIKKLTEMQEDFLKDISDLFNK